MCVFFLGDPLLLLLFFLVRFLFSGVACFESLNFFLQWVIFGFVGRRIGSHAFSAD